MPEILHITPRARWEQAVADGEYRSDDLATEGFIHCLTSEQLPYPKFCWLETSSGEPLRLTEKPRILAEDHHLESG